MIGKLTGEIVHTSTAWVILETNAVGYKVHVRQELLSHLPVGASASVWTHLAVKENALDLYGFEAIDELVFFELLLSVSGIGPKTALSILDAASITALKKAVRSGEIGPLTKVSGIGKKNAEKIALELRGKLGEDSTETEGGADRDVEVFEALTALGYSTTDAREALKQLSRSSTEETEARIKEALKYLGK